jgi:hypothetical protein
MKTIIQLSGILAISVVCFALTGCASKTDEVTGISNVKETARQQAILDLDKRYSSYEIVDENYQEWKSGTSEVPLDDSRLTRSVDIKSYKCTIRVKNAVVRKEGETSVQSDREAQKAETVKAANEKKTSVEGERAVTTHFGKQAEIAGLLGPLAKRLTATNLLDSDVAMILQRAPNLPKLVMDSDLRILDNAHNPPFEGQQDPEQWPIGYVLFEKDNLTKGTKISTKNLNEEIQPALVKGCKAAANADPTSLADDRDPRVTPTFREGKRSLEDCSAVGWAVFNEVGQGGEGFRAFSVAFRAAFEIIEPQTPLAKWLSSAKYRTNAASAAVEQMVAMRKGFTGTWKAHDGTAFIPHGATLKIQEDGTFKFNSGDSSVSGTYVVAQWPDVRGDLITVITDGGSDYSGLTSGVLHLGKLTDYDLKQE